MKFSAIFEEYSYGMASVNAHISTIRREAGREFQRLTDSRTRQRNLDLPEDQIVGMGNFAFVTAITGECHFYGFRDYTIESQIESLEKHTNRQYQWLLAEAYELFEDYLEQAYAGAALSNRDHWPLRDYGSITVNSLDTVDFQFLLEQVRAKNNKPQSLLNQLRSRLPILKRFGSDNELKIDLWFAVFLIEKLRHHIVHTKGLISSKSDFIEQLLKKSGSYNNGKPHQHHLDLINEYVQPIGNIHYVRLLDFTLPSKGGPFRRYVSMFDKLSNCLLAYAHLLASSFERLESKKPSPRDAAGN